MAAEEHRRLGALCDIVPGPSGSLLEEMSAGIDGIPVITPADVTDEHTVDTSRIRQVSSDTAESMAGRFRLWAGDVVLVRQATTHLGRLALAGEEHTGWLFATSCLRLRVISDEILPSYLLYYLGHAPVRDWLKSRANVGQAVNTLTTRALQELPVSVPDLRSQRALVGALDAINSQIRANAGLNRKLGLLGHAVLTDSLGDDPLGD